MIRKGIFFKSELLITVIGFTDKRKIKKQCRKKILAHPHLVLELVAYIKSLKTVAPETLTKIIKRK